MPSCGKKKEVYIKGLFPFFFLAMLCSKSFEQNCAANDAAAILLYLLDR